MKKIYFFLFLLVLQLFWGVQLASGIELRSVGSKKVFIDKLNKYYSASAIFFTQEKNKIYLFTDRFFFPPISRGELLHNFQRYLELRPSLQRQIEIILQARRKGRKIFIAVPNRQAFFQVRHVRPTLAVTPPVRFLPLSPPQMLHKFQLRHFQLNSLYVGTQKFKTWAYQVAWTPQYSLEPWLDFKWKIGLHYLPTTTKNIYITEYAHILKFKKRNFFWEFSSSIEWWKKSDSSEYNVGLGLNFGYNVKWERLRLDNVSIGVKKIKRPSGDVDTISINYGFSF